MSTSENNETKLETKMETTIENQPETEPSSLEKKLISEIRMKIVSSDFLTEKKMEEFREKNVFPFQSRYIDFLNEKRQDILEQLASFEKINLVVSPIEEPVVEPWLVENGLDMKLWKIRKTGEGKRLSLEIRRVGGSEGRK